MAGTLGVIGGTLNGGSSGGSGTPYLSHESPTVTVTAGGSANTKGSWTEVIASTSVDATALQMMVQAISGNGTNTATLIDVGVGGSGSEVAVAENIAVGGAPGTFSSFLEFMLPLDIPSGSRVSVRSQCVIASRTASINMTLVNGGAITAPADLDVLGTSTSTSSGTSVPSGSWGEVIASTSRAYQAIVAIPSSSSSSLTNSASRLEVARGASSSEVIIGAISYITSASEFIASSSGGASWAMEGVPAGTRLSVRRTGGVIDVTLIGVP